MIVSHRILAQFSVLCVYTLLKKKIREWAMVLFVLKTLCMLYFWTVLAWLAVCQHRVYLLYLDPKTERGNYSALLAGGRDLPFLNLDMNQNRPLVGRLH